MMNILEKTAQSNPVIDNFDSSLSVDKRLYKHDIMGSIAHVTMLGECNIISIQESEIIAKTLSDIFYNINEGKLSFSGKNICDFVDNQLVSRLGDIGLKVNLARAMSDRIALDNRMYVRESIDEILILLKQLIDKIIEIAENHFLTLMPGFNSMRKIQPTTLAHFLIAYAEMFMRDIDRLAEDRIRVNMMPLGSENGFGSAYPINRKKVAQLLNFEELTPNSLDSISDNDYVIDFLNTISIVMMHLSRFSADILTYSCDEFNFVKLSDDICEQSETYPQKSLPQALELIRGKTSRCYGNLMSVLSLMQGLNLMDSKDLSENKEAIFDSENTVKNCIKTFTEILPNMEFNTQEMLKATNTGFTAANDCISYLVMKGCSYEKATNITNSLIEICKEKNKRLDTISLDDFQAFSPLFEKDIIPVLRARNIVQSRKTEGSSNKTMVKTEIRNIKRKLDKLFA